MSAIPRIISRTIRSQLPRRTVRLKITLLYGGLFLVSGTLLLVITYFLVKYAVGPPAGSASGPGAIGNAPPAGQGPLTTSGGHGQTGPGVALSQQLHTVMRQLVINSGIALAVMSLISIGLGWVVAGRALRPLRTITTTVRDISATSLHRRLALDGPDDELTELGNTFDSLLDRLESSFRAQRQFVANASHELRTPLARQRVLGQIALSDPAPTLDSLRATHERILAAGAHQERLIEALLTLSRGQAGLEVREWFDLGLVTHEVIAARQAEASYQAVTFRPTISRAPIAGHRQLTERLVTNLIDNAIKYNRTGGWIQVSTGIVDDHATLTVTNTGPVVPTDTIDDLFQPFRRLAATRAARAAGLGLGLSIVRAVAEAHNATISTVARPEGGLSIRIDFPRLTGPQQPPATGTEQLAVEVAVDIEPTSR